MARGRAYSVSFSGVSVTAVQDLIGLYCGSAMACELHGIEIGQITATTVAALRVTVKRLTATVTPGSVGSSATPRKALSGDAAATATARINDTTQATTSGTAETLHSDVLNVINGLSFFWPPNDIPVIGLSQAAVVSLDTPPGSAMTMSGTLYFAEIL
jgi:hypothetical protein